MAVLPFDDVDEASGIAVEFDVIRRDVEATRGVHAARYFRTAISL
ncbi:hypothetical protein [Rhodococcus jostii]|nr:hypothetical protein [Rhodococcus jostii]